MPSTNYTRIFFCFFSETVFSLTEVPETAELASTVASTKAVKEEKKNRETKAHIPNENNKYSAENLCARCNDTFINVDACIWTMNIRFVSTFILFSPNKKWCIQWIITQRWIESARENWKIFECRVERRWSVRVSNRLEREEMNKIYHKIKFENRHFCSAERRRWGDASEQATRGPN